MCKCEKCGKPTTCEERYCESCLINEVQANVTKNLDAGGRFYGEKLIKETEHTV